jgi:catechol 2,3-dioxygenase-like lactoylglutathione lyase family enzyme
VAVDVGLNHVALQVSDMDQSIAFYRRWARLDVVDRLEDPRSGNKAARLRDETTGFTIALVQSPSLPVEHSLSGLGHLGVGCADRAEVDRLTVQAEQEGCLRRGPIDSGFPLGYWAFLADPDGHQLELSYGQNDKDA